MDLANVSAKFGMYHGYGVYKTLGICGVKTTVSTWSSKEAPIDLLFDRKDQVINICEMKFSSSVYRIDKKYAEILIK